MADGRLRLEASANFSRLNSAFERQKEKTARLEEEVRRLGEGHGRMGKKSETAFQGMVRNARNAITAYVGVHAAIATVNAAIEQEIDLQRRAGEANKNLQEERILFTTQTARFTPNQRAEFERRIQEAGSRAGITEAEALSIGRRALTATSDSDVDLRIEKAAGIVEKLSDVLGPTISQTGGLPGAILDLQRTIGGTQEEAIGFALTALDISRLEEISELPNLIRTIAGAAAVQTGVEDKGVLAEQTLALFSAFQSVSGDVIGANTSTAIVNFIAALQREQGDRTLTPDQLIDALRDEEGIKFIGKSFSKPVQEDLIRSGSTIAATYRDNLKSVSQDFEAAFERIKGLTQGAGDVELSSALAAQRSEALATRIARETRGVQRDAFKIVSNLDPVARPGFRNFIRRNVESALRRVGAAASQDNIENGLEISRNNLAERLSRGFFSPIIDRAAFGLGRAARIRKARGDFSDEELLTLGDSSDPTLVAARAQLRELLEIQKAQMAEESAERKADNAKLADTVAKAVNQSVGNARLTSEQEN